MYEQLRCGKISRREFIVRAAALGVGAPLLLALVNAADEHGAAAQEPHATRPAHGTQTQVRGAGGELRVRQWYAPDNVVAHLTDFPDSTPQVSSLILEPLLSYAPDGSLLPTLVTEVPAKANGGLSDDLTGVTLNLRDDVLWSDGEPFTADDVLWTWEWINDASSGSVHQWIWSGIQAIEPMSPTQVQLIYAKPTLAWFLPIAGAVFGGILPRHVWAGKDKAAVDAAFAIDPIGTGPYKIETFVPGDQIVCSINERYREPNKPYFETVRFQGGGDSASDAQAVLVDGDGDVTSDLRIAPDLLKELQAAGDKARVIAGSPTNVEQIVFNFSNPNQDVEGERSHVSVPHPFLTERNVRQAMALAIDRESISTEIFLGGEIERPARNVLTGIAALESPNTSIEFDIAAANDLLDRAGWERTGDVRTRDGIELAVSYYTTGIGDLAPLVRYRLEIQAAVKAGWEAIGIKVELGQVSAADFFNITPENERSYAHFYRDAEMYSQGQLSPWPDTVFSQWYAGPDNSNVAQRANDWMGANIQRYVDPEFDRLYEEATNTTDPEHAAALYIQMNDYIVNEFVVVPLVAQPFGTYALNNRISEENVAPSSWEPLFWNIANWRTVET
jgi:peptide/nickel transport system substrate-binding protein